jgi:hypothetical protein
VRKIERVVSKKVQVLLKITPSLFYIGVVKWEVVESDICER